MLRSLSLLLLLAAPASALTYSRHVLSNGLVVLLYKDASAPLVAVNVWYKVGSRDEQPGRTGFAHLFEHYMFECSKNVPQGGYFDTVQRLGGIANAFTANDKTNYYSVVPAGGLDEMLRLEADRMGFLQSCMSQQSLDKQRGIVKNEKREREGRPYGGLFAAIMAQSFPSPHPYQWPVIGSMQDLEAASLGDVSSFHKSWYVPGNAVLAIAGDIDEAKALERARFWFEGLAAGAAPRRADPAPVTGLGGRRESVISDASVPAPLLVVAFPIPGRGQAGAEAAAAAAAVIGQGRGARLARVLQTGERPLALSVEAFTIGLEATDLLVIDAMPAEGVTLAELELAIHNEVAKLAAKGPDAAELARVKARMRTAFYDAQQNVEGIAQALAEGEARAGDPDLFVDGELARVQALDADAVREAARRMTVDNASVLKMTPPAKEAK